VSDVVHGIKTSDLDPLPPGSYTANVELPVILLGKTYRAQFGLLADFVVTGEGINRPPTGVDHTAIAFDTATVPLTGNLLAGAGDPDGDVVSIGSITYAGTPVAIGAAFNAMFGIFYVGANGDWSYTLGSSARALTTGGVEHEIFTVVLADGKGGIKTNHLTVTITGTNSAPIVSYLNGSTPMNQVLQGNLIYRLAFDYETAVTIGSFTIDGIVGTQPLGVDVSIPGAGTINIASNGDYTFTPVTGFTGPVPTITYLVTDGVNNVPGYLTLAVNPSVAGSQPVVLFTSPRSAPFDDGSGQATGGAALFIHGVRFGDPADLGTAIKVYIGGVEVGTYVAMDVDPYAKPGFGRQRIQVRVGALAGLTPGQPQHIKVVSGGQESNTDSVFTPNPGRLLYVSQSGDDATAVYGDPNHPWRYLQTIDRLGAYGAARAGDQVLVRAGVGGVPWTDTGFATAWMRFRDAAQQGSNPTGVAGTGWLSFVGYPGEVVQYETQAGTKGGFQGPGQDVTGITGDFVSFSNFRIQVDGGATRDAGPVNMQYNAQECEVVGCELGPWVAGDSAVLNCAGVSGEGNFFKILGCHIHGIQGTSALQNHGVYPGTNSYGWTIAYSWIHDITGGSHLSFNDSDGGTGVFETPFGVWMGFTNISIHHNWMENAAKYAVSFNDVGAQQGQLDAKIWNNMIIGTGLPPFHFGTTNTTVDVTVAFNTVYNCNTTVTGGNAMVRNDGWLHSPGRVLRLYDNIFAFGPSTAAGTGWLNDTTGFSSGVAWSRNLYWVNGDATAPSPSSIDSLAVIGDPKFTNPATSDFSLQASSPAVNAGTQALPAGMLVGDDYSSMITREPGGAPDIGFSEYASPAPFNTSAPTSSGGPQVGVATSVTIGSWGNAPTGYSRQFKLNGTPAGSAITGTGTASYTPVAGDERKTLTCVVTATNGAGSTPANVTCGVVAVGAGAPVNTVLPVVSGSLAAGTLSSLTDGTWSPAWSTFTYDWTRNGVVIAGETGNTYMKGPADVGAMIVGRVYAIDPVNGSPVAASVAVGPITPAPADPVTVQSSSHTLVASTNVDFTFSSVGANSLMLAFLAEWDNAPFNAHFSDTQGHVSGDMTRTTAQLYNGNNPWIGWAYVKSTSTGPYTLTINPDSGQGGAAVVSEISGLDPTTVQDIPPDNAFGNTSTITVTASAATTKATDLIRVGIGLVGTGHTVTADDPSAWDLVGHVDGTFNGAWVFERKPHAIETFTFSATTDAAGWIAQSIVIKGS